MNINEIMERDLRAAEAERQNDLAKGEHVREADSFTGVEFAIVVLAILSAAASAFFAGMSFQARQTLNASRDFAAWNERTDLEATERARAMSNAELLATERPTK